MVEVRRLARASSAGASGSYINRCSPLPLPHRRPPRHRRPRDELDMIRCTSPQGPTATTPGRVH